MRLDGLKLVTPVQTIWLVIFHLESDVSKFAWNVKPYLQSKIWNFKVTRVSSADSFAVILALSTSSAASLILEVQIILQTNGIMNRNVRNRTYWPVRPTKSQISLRIRAVWSESSPSAWSNFTILAIQNAPSEDSDQTAQMRRLIWIFAGRTCPKIRFLTRLLIGICTVCLI